MYDIKVACLPEQIPDIIELRVAHLDLGDLILAKDVELPEGVTLDMPEDTPVCHLPGEAELAREAAAEAAEAAAEDEVCAPANDNAPGQVVLSGHRTAVERAVEIAAERGARRAIMLPVSAPFHCSLMAPAAEVMAEALAEVDMQLPSLTLIANVTAAPVVDPDSIRGFLVEQVTAMVRWRESVLRMKEEGVETLIELGTGKILSGLIRRIDRDLEVANAGTPDDIEALVKIL